MRCCVEFWSHLSRFLFQNGPLHGSSNSPRFFCPCETSVFYGVSWIPFFSQLLCGFSKWCGHSSGPCHNIALSGQINLEVAMRLLASDALSLRLFFGLFWKRLSWNACKTSVLKKDPLRSWLFFSQSRFTRKDVPITFGHGHFEDRPFRWRKLISTKTHFFKIIKMQKATANVVFPDLALKHEFGAGGLQDDVVEIIRPRGARWLFQMVVFVLFCSECNSRNLPDFRWTKRASPRTATTTLVFSSSLPSASSVFP